MSRAPLLLCLAPPLVLLASCGTDQGRNDQTGPTDSNPPAATGGSEGSGGSPSPTVPFGEPVPVPATIEAEAYLRYAETDGMQQGSQVCVSPVNFSVDVGESAAASGGCFIGWTTSGEWLEYDIDVEDDGAFDIHLALSSVVAGQTVKLVVDEVTRSTIEVPVTDGVSFVEVNIPGVGLTAGQHALRVLFATGETNLDYIRLDATENCVAACQGKSCGDDFCGGTCGECASDQMCSSSYTCVEPFVLPVQEYGQLSVLDGQLVDQNGNSVQLRGVSTQWLNWDATYAGNKDNMEFMRDDWGLEVYRIANGVEGFNGYADPDVRENRFAKVSEIIEMAIDLDLYVLVDWHTHEIEHKELAEEFYAEIAATYGDRPNVIYEVFNEPIGTGDSATFWENELKPYHEDLVEVIRAQDPDNIIVLGTPRWDQHVDIAAADPVAGDNLLYALHFYSCTHGAWLRTKAQTALDAGVGLFVTEWGSTHSDGGTASNPGVCLEEAARWHDFLDEKNISSTAWKLTDDTDSSAILTGAPPSGPWGEEHLTEHGRFVRGIIQR